jgi:acyl carrier protein
MLEAVKKIISEEFSVAEDEVTPESNLRNDLHIDSMAAVNLSFEIEGKFDIKISDDELASLVTVDDIVKLLEAKGVKE